MKRLTTLIVGLVVSLASMANHPETSAGHVKAHHNHYELEVSMNNEMHSELTGSVYFLPLKKIQITAEDSFNHFASVLVQEIPFRNSSWGTFAGIGGTYGIEKHIDYMTHTEETEYEYSFIVQSGLAYSINRHWSTGFTFSPGWDFKHKEVASGLTFDLVYGF